MLTAALWLSMAGSPCAAAGKDPDAVTVVDLRVGLASAFNQPTANLWQGRGQGGIVQLHRGHVSGILIPFPPGLAAGSSTRLAVSFAHFRSALGSTQAFDARACGAGPARLGAWFQLDAPDVLAAEPAEVATWVARGVRVFSLAGRRDSSLATSAFPSGPERVIGLTAAGQQVASAILAEEALIDVSNLSDVSIVDVLSLARLAGKPVIATRASARAVRARPGSLTDWQLRSIAQSGGVVGLALDRDLIGDGDRAELSDVLRQVDHLTQVASWDGVAIASGFETGALPPPALGNAGRFPHLAAALEAHGVSQDQIRKLFSENARRVLCGQDRGSH